MKKDHQWPIVPLVTTDPSYIDDRGEIKPILDIPFNSSAILHTNAGSVRANHYHKTDWHYCYIISGKIEYYEREINSTEKPKKYIFAAGQTFFTPPLVEHVMLFPENTTFLTFSRNPRLKDIYEDDVVRIDLLTDINS